MGVHFLEHFVIVALAIGVIDDRAHVDFHALVLFGVQEARLDIFVIEHQKAVLGRAVDREEVHAVMVLADLFGLFSAAVCGRKGGHVAGDRLAPGAKHLHIVTLGHGHRVLEAHRNRREAEQRCGRGRLRERALGRQRVAEQSGRDGGQTAHQEVPALQVRIHHLVEVAVVRGVALRFVTMLVPRRLFVVGIIALEIVHCLPPDFIAVFDWVSPRPLVIHRRPGTTL